MIAIIFHHVREEIGDIENGDAPHLRGESTEKAWNMAQLVNLFYA